MSTTTRTRKPGHWLRAIIVILALGLLVLLFRNFPIDEWLSASFRWVRGLGPVGYAFFVALYTVATVLSVPGSILTLGAGAAYGIALGSVLVILGATLGATSAFLVGRYLARDWVAKRVAGNKKFAAVDESVGRSGFKIVLMTRLSPVFPFVLLNYAFSITKVTLRDYVLASMTGMIPGTVLYVYLGKVAADISTGTAADSLAQTLFTWIGLAITLAVTIYVTRLARKALRESEVEA